MLRIYCGGARSAAAGVRVQSRVDVVRRRGVGGQSTRHVRAGFEQAGLTQDQVRQLFLGISPMSYMERFAAAPKRVLVVHATYDLTFPLHLSLDVLKNFRARGVDYVSKVLPCGHYTSGETPYKYIDGWYLGSFVYNALAYRGARLALRAVVDVTASGLRGSRQSAQFAGLPLLRDAPGLLLRPASRAG